MKSLRSRVFDALGTSDLQNLPDITFVVPCFNEAPHILANSLGSVALQNYRDFECLVIDESTDPASSKAAADICNSDPRFRHVIPTQRIGLAGSLNLGISQARGEFIARFDSDDVCLPDRLSLQLDWMKKNPRVDVLGGGIEIIDREGKTLAFRDYPLEHDAISRQFHRTTAVAHPTVLIRTAALRAIGGYDPQFRFAEDLDLWLRMLNSGVRFANLPQTLVKYRQNNTNRNPDHWRYNLRARKKNFTSSNFIGRLIGIGLIGTWLYTPSFLQKLVFKLALLRSKQRMVA